MNRERERLRRLPKEQQEQLAREVQARYPNLLALANQNAVIRNNRYGMR